LLTAVADNRWVIWARRVIVFAAVALAAFLALAAGSAATENAWILFTASPDRGTQAPQLFRIHVSGTGLGQITSGRRPANDPVFAPDGTQLAFARLGSGLFVVNVDGSALRRLTGNGYDRYPVWSPNGRLIAFVRGARSGYHLWVMSANGKRQHRLRQAPSTAGRAAWTPDGESLIIASGGAFYEVSATTGKVRRPPHRERVLLHLCGRCRGLARPPPDLPRRCRRRAGTLDTSTPSPNGDRSESPSLDSDHRLGVRSWPGPLPGRRARGPRP
jgi:dipeptidyl aminopeptidase/acylaminoacyl peptidase